MISFGLHLKLSQSPKSLLKRKRRKRKLGSKVRSLKSLMVVKKSQKMKEV